MHAQIKILNSDRVLNFKHLESVDYQVKNSPLDQSHACAHSTQACTEDMNLLVIKSFNSYIRLQVLYHYSSTAGHTEPVDIILYNDYCNKCSLVSIYSKFHNKD